VEAILDEPTAIIEFICCQPNTPRLSAVTKATLAGIRSMIEKHIKKTYFEEPSGPVRREIGAEGVAGAELRYPER
jgi:hypothetical protein